ncbi:hypothetical protein EDD11_009947 [Mortierella claussenii]|nr:hypothetical protein EDD11_009947 [Mortierella claussenii]
MAMSRPSKWPHYRPLPLPLKGVHQPQLNHVHGALPAPAPLLHRSQLTSLTLTGHFRLETFLKTILPLVPELTYLDICLRCYEWRDEIRLDRVLRTCPKLQYLSVDRNMIGKVEFGELGQGTAAHGSDSESDQGHGRGDQDDSGDDEAEDADDVDNVDKDGAGEATAAAAANGHPKGVADGVYAVTAWHLKYAHVPFEAHHPSDNSNSSSSGSSGNGSDSAKLDSNATTTRKRHFRKQTSHQQQRQRPLALRVLKLKKVRMLEQDFVQLLKLCPLLEEMDVFSTIYWGWTRGFLHTVAQSCPRIRHLHLTTNYTSGSENGGDGGGGAHGPNNGVMQAGIVIFHETLREHLQQPPAAVAPTDSTAGARSNINGGHGNGSGSSGMPESGAITSTMARSTTTATAAIVPELPYDPVIELIKLFPELLSYDARYVRFQDRTLVTLQQTCRQLERLDLESCREVSSKAVDMFLRHSPTLKYFSASRIKLRIEDIIVVMEERKRVLKDALTLNKTKKKELEREQRRRSRMMQKSRRRMDSEDGPVSDDDDDEDDEYDSDEQEDEDEDDDNDEENRDEEELFEQFNIQGPPKWWVCEGLETFIIGVMTPSVPMNSTSYPYRDRGWDLQRERAADFQFYYRDQQGGSGSSNSGAGSGSTGHGYGNSKDTSKKNGSSQREYDHTQYCTFVLFEQLGRLKKLKRIELHGGRFDLTVHAPSATVMPQHHYQHQHHLQRSNSPLSLSSSPLSCSPPADQILLPSSFLDQDPTKSMTRPGLIAKKSLSRMKSFFALSGKQKSLDEAPVYLWRTDSDASKESHKQTQKAKEKRKDKNKGKDKGKGVDRALNDSLNSNSSEGCLLDPLRRRGAEAACTRHAHSKHCQPLDKKQKIVPLHRMGLQPLADLKNLESFSMTWSNFPMLREQEIAWICQHWTALEWMSLGLVPDNEWEQIRSWVRARRSDVVVVFER